MPDQPIPSISEYLAVTGQAQFAALDNLRRAQGSTLAYLGFGARECAYDVVASGRHWRLRHYKGTAKRSPLLLVPAPIKRPYIWDLMPSVSAVRFCIDHEHDVHLLEWIAPSEADGDVGIANYAEAIIAAGGTVTASDARPFIIGHSLGGTLSAIACALEPSLARGLVLLGAPLSFEPGSSNFRDLVVEREVDLPHGGTIAGSSLSQGCALLSPETFFWSRLIDTAASLSDPAAMDLRIHVERWALDEVPLPSRLICEMMEWLYHRDSFHHGTLALGARRLGPSDLRLPVLAVVNSADEIGPRRSVEPFFAKMPQIRTQIIEHPAEIGVGLQHLAILVGRQAHSDTWPEIEAWLAANS